jgi:hypothetical protein
MKKLKLTFAGIALTIVALLSIGSIASNAVWMRYMTYRFGHPDSLDGASVEFRDGKAYLQDFYGNRNYDAVMRHLTARMVTLDSGLFARRGLFGPSLTIPDTSLAAFFNAAVLFYSDVYMTDTKTFGSYSGNGARLKFVNATGTQILNNKGIAFQVAQNADASSLLLDSAKAYIGTNLGIKTTSPEYPLHVVGTTYLNGTLYVKDAAAIASYSGNGARIKLTNATGVDILGNNGVVMNIAAGAPGGTFNLNADGSWATSTMVRGTTTFTTTSTRKALYIAGATSSDYYVVSPISASGTTLPVAGDLLAVYAKTDSLIVCRAAGTTSGLGFNYIRIK